MPPQSTVLSLKGTQKCANCSLFNDKELKNFTLKGFQLCLVLTLKRPTALGQLKKFY